MTQRLLFLDFETYYDQQYSLRKLTTPEYILDPRFEMIGCAVAVDDQPSVFLEGEEFAAFLAQHPPELTTTVTFNALFDNSILAWQFGYVPRRMLDTMGMARALHGHRLKKGASLKALSEYFDVGIKGSEIVLALGKHKAAIKACDQEWASYRAYANNDNELCRAIFKKCIGEFPYVEQRIMDLVIRACVCPRFEVDVPLLQAHLGNIQREKAALLAATGADKADLMSSTKFAEMLEKFGVEIELKRSPTGKQIPALAKSDEFMESLAEHHDPAVQALAAARLGHKSTIEETRTEKLIAIGNLPWRNYRDGNPRLYSGGTMPIPLRYGGAHTHRLSGEWRLNMQNMPTSRSSKGRSKLRHSLKAPPGHKVIVADLGQIEARLGGWVAGCKTLIDQFAKKLDPYNRLAEAIFGRKVNRKLAGTVDEVMGFIGKTGILGLGYGCGDKKFLSMVLSSARIFGIDLSKIGGFDEAKARTTVQAYRNVYGEIQKSWGHLSYLINTCFAIPNSKPVKVGPCWISYGEIMPPNQLPMRYANLKWDSDYDSYTYTYGRESKKHRIYGPKLLENIVQNLARIVVMNAAVRLADLGYNFVLQAHDELVFIVPDADVANAMSIIHTEMTRPPTWAPDLPLTADVGVGDSYGAAK